MRDQIDRSFSETFPLAWTERYTKAHEDFQIATEPTPCPEKVLVRMRDPRDGARYSPYAATTPYSGMAWAIRNFDPFQS